MAGHQNLRCASASASSSHPDEASLSGSWGSIYSHDCFERRGDQSAALGATKTGRCTETKGRHHKLAAAVSAGNSC